MIDEIKHINPGFCSRIAQNAFGGINYYLKQLQNGAEVRDFIETLLNKFTEAINAHAQQYGPGDSGNPKLQVLANEFCVLVRKVIAKHPTDFNANQADVSENAEDDYKTAEPGQEYSHELGEEGGNRWDEGELYVNEPQAPTCEDCDRATIKNEQGEYYPRCRDCDMKHRKPCEVAGCVGRITPGYEKYGVCWPCKSS